MIQKIQNFLILIYFPFFFICIEISKLYGIESLIVLSNLPLLLYLLINLKSKKAKFPIIRNDFLIILISFYLLLQFFATLKNDSIYLALANIITFISIYFFSISFYKISDFMSFEEKMKYLYISIIFAFVLVISPLLLKGSFVIGSHYKLLFDASKIGGQKLPFLKTTLDAPNLAAIVFLLSFYLILNKNKGLKINIIFLIFSFILSLTELLLINRRGPMFGAFISIFFLLVPRVFVSIVPILLFIPFYWDSILKILVPLFYNSPITNLIANKDYSNLVEAGYRSYVWEVVGRLFLNPSFSSSYMFGYGKLPELEKLGGYGHAHNGFLQLFLLSGIIAPVVLLLIVAITLFRSFYILKIGGSSFSKLLPLVFFYLFFVSATESIFLNNFFSNNLFLIILFLINISYYHNIKLKQNVKSTK